MISGIAHIIANIHSQWFLFLLCFPKTQQKIQLANISAFLRKTDYYTSHTKQKQCSYKDFRSSFPVVTYETLQSHIDRAVSGEKNVLTPGSTTDFAKSSGTTSAKSKYIPMNKKSLFRNHFRAGMDVFAWSVARYHVGHILRGKTLSITGSFSAIPQPTQKENTQAISGDISAFLSKFVTHWAQIRQFPQQSIALLPDWREKKDAIVQLAPSTDVRAIFGTPTWTLRILEGIQATGTTVAQTWPHLALFIHGAVGFEPYKQSFLTLTKGLHIRLVEAYNATEGFFAFGDESTNGLFLLTHHGIFYEFVEKKYWHDPTPHTIPLWEVRTGCDYALVITTYNGLVRYMVGDVVRFTSTAPYKIIIVGRTKHFINGFGEEVMASQIEQAVSVAVEKTHALVHAFTVAPAHHTDGTGVHKWLIAFEQHHEPHDIAIFTDIIDKHLQQINSDYEAKRNGILHAPEVTIVPPDLFMNYLTEKKKLGGQYKIPVATNDLSLINEIYSV